MLRSIALTLLGLAVALLVIMEMGLFAPRAPLVEAAEAGDLVKVKYLIGKGRSINEVSKVKIGWTPLIAAIYQDNTNVTRFLIAAGADVNKADKRGETPLMWAMIEGDKGVSVVKDLIAHGADVNAKDAMGATVLSCASSDPPKPKILEIVKAAISEEGKKKTK